MSKAEKIYLKSPEWAKSLAVSMYGKIQYRKRYSGSYQQLLETVRSTHTWTTKKIYDYQCERMHNMLAYCYEKIPYYHKLFINHGLTINDITNLDDLKKIPILKKDVLRSSPQEFRPANRKLVHASHKTSGSTGTPVAIDVDEETYKLAMALLVDFEERNGVPFGARRATFAGRIIKSTDNLTPPFWKYNSAENQLLFSSYHLNTNTFPHYREKLRQFAPLELIGYPSAIYEIANHYHLKGIVPEFRPKLIVTNSENLLNWQRERIEAVFNCKVRDYYSTAEYLNFAGEDDEGIYHSNPLPGITELEPLESGEGQHKLIMTSLTNTAMPLVRYDVGDLAVPAPGNELSSGIPRLSEIEGRIDEYIETQDGRKIGRVSQIFKGVPGIKEAQIVQHKCGEAQFNIVSETEKNTLAESMIIENSKLRLGEDFKVTINYQSRIPRQKNGKFRFVLKTKQSSPM
ncbi:phenylacetate--CoA ligase family protein [Marinobacter sp. OP 3.4]|uniref:phenylacetate--CoA ligase family protein n=1 Tax=Marinobacter sp. OP 3.4 TaxID=3076501 RepID=UPI002E1EA87D